MGISYFLAPQQNTGQNQLKGRRASFCWKFEGTVSIMREGYGGRRMKQLSTWYLHLASKAIYSAGFLLFPFHPSSGIPTHGLMPSTFRVGLTHSVLPAANRPSLSHLSWASLVPYVFPNPIILTIKNHHHTICKIRLGNEK